MKFKLQYVQIKTTYDQVKLLPEFAFKLQYVQIKTEISTIL